MAIQRRLPREHSTWHGMQQSETGSASHNVVIEVKVSVREEMLSERVAANAARIG